MRHKHEPQINCADHLTEMLEPVTRDLAVNRAVKLLKQVECGVEGEQPLDFDAIACSGISGLLFAPPVARALGKPLIIVRKQKGDHSYQLVEGDHAAKGYIVLDDLICSGTTLERIVSRIEDVNKAARCLGFLGYARLLNDDPKRRREAWRPARELDAKYYSSTLCRQMAGGIPSKSISLYDAGAFMPLYQYQLDGSVTRIIDASPLSYNDDFIYTQPDKPTTMDWSSFYAAWNTQKSKMEKYPIEDKIKGEVTK